MKLKQRIYQAFKANAVLYTRYTWYHSTGLIGGAIFNGKFNFFPPFLEYHNKSGMLIATDLLHIDSNG